MSEWHKHLLTTMNRAKPNLYMSLPLSLYPSPSDPSWTIMSKDSYAPTFGIQGDRLCELSLLLLMMILES